MTGMGEKAPNTGILLQHTSDSNTRTHWGGIHKFYKPSPNQYKDSHPQNFLGAKVPNSVIHDGTYHHGTKMLWYISVDICYDIFAVITSLKTSLHNPCNMMQSLVSVRRVFIWNRFCHVLKHLQYHFRNISHCCKNLTLVGTLILKLISSQYLVNIGSGNRLLPGRKLG